MSPNLQRAVLLFQQSRFDLAETELRQALTAEPGSAHAHALLALCLSERKNYQEATDEARQAVHLEPDFPFAYYAHARVLYDRHHYPEAITAINEAIRLDPYDADYFALLAGIQFQESRWTEALSAAEQGLQSDPEHVACTNFQAMALVKLGRKEEAGKTIDTALSKNPDNSLTHANQGWTLLEQGDAKKAAEHFREALRLDPENEWARQGIIESLKARNIIYAGMLKYFLWMAKFNRKGQWGIIMAGYIGNQILGAVARSNPEYAPWILPIRILYLVFALMTWMAYPFFNLLLRLDRFGRLVLSREQTVASNWFGLCLLLALTGLLGCGFANVKTPWLIMALIFGVLLIPVSAIYRCQEGWPRNVMAGYAILVALGGLAAVGLSFHSHGESTDAISLAIFSGIAGIAGTWVGNLLITRRPRY